MYVLLILFENKKNQKKSTIDNSHWIDSLWNKNKLDVWN